MFTYSPLLSLVDVLANTTRAEIFQKHIILILQDALGDGSELVDPVTESVTKASINIKVLDTAR